VVLKKSRDAGGKTNFDDFSRAAGRASPDCIYNAVHRSVNYPIDDKIGGARDI
jgi:hypothetical protein